MTPLQELRELREKYMEFRRELAEGREKYPALYDEKLCRSEYRSLGGVIEDLTAIISKHEGADAELHKAGREIAEMSDEEFERLQRQRKGADTTC